MEMHRVVVRGLTALAAVAAAVAAVVPFCDRPGGPALLAELDRPAVFAALAALCLSGAALLGSRRPGLRKAAGAVLAAAAVLGVLAVPAHALAGDPFPDREWDVPAPDGSARRLVVAHTPGLTGGSWRVYVEAGSFPTARRHPVAAYPAGSAKGVLEASWQGPGRIRLIGLDHTHHDLRVTAAGRPLDPLNW
ncbi:hypothetical protein ACGFXC_35625 [Streptomyces sp. NPDC048507]|uniref:hypothetical protein n=1 Tax=Streptomyces sp. NPDC048507 TaxID=3365560 RepID=UPI003722F175